MPHPAFGSTHAFSNHFFSSLREIIFFNSLFPCAIPVPSPLYVARSMRPERSSLDLNNLPEEYGKQAAEESSTTTAASAETARFKKKKNGGMDEIGKVYECRFCALKFCKSQALGGHMNRHRQERETETLNRARQLVYSNECLPATGVHLGFRNQNALGGPQPVHLAGYSTTSGFGVSDQSLQFQPLYPRLPVQSTATNSLHPYIYSSSNPPDAIPFQSSYSPHHYSVRGDYYIGHVLPNISPRPLHDVETSYTCFGGPLSYNFPVDRNRPQTMSPDGDAPQNQIEGLYWNCNYGPGNHTGGNPAPDIDPSFP